MNTYHDGNGKHVMLAVENDGITLMIPFVTPSTHKLHISDGTSGTDNGPSVSRHDGNHIPIMMGISSADGKTPIAAYGDSNGNLLVKST